MERIGKREIEERLLKDLLIPQLLVGRTSVHAKAELARPQQHQRGHEQDRSSNDAKYRTEHLVEPMRVRTMEHGVGQERRHNRTRGQKGRSSTPDFGDLPLLLRQFVDSELVDPLLETCHCSSVSEDPDS